MSTPEVAEKPWRSELRKTDERIHDLIADLMAVHHSSRDWSLDALCAQTDPELFFPGKGQNPKKAKKVCERCPVIRECREFADTHDIDHGVWGGMSAYERDLARRPGKQMDLAGKRLAQVKAWQRRSLAGASTGTASRDHAPKAAPASSRSPAWSAPAPATPGTCPT